MGLLRPRARDACSPREGEREGGEEIECVRVCERELQSERKMSERRMCV